MIVELVNATSRRIRLVRSGSCVMLEQNHGPKETRNTDYSERGYYYALSLRVCGSADQHVGFTACLTDAEIIAL